jgi:HAMP domain-containing protein
VEITASAAVAIASQPPTSGTIWAILGCIAAAGAVGGFVNAVIGGAGGTGRLLMPQVIQPQGVFQLGFIGNVGLGAVGAVLTWGLYGPLKDSVMIGARAGVGIPANLTVTALVGAALTGAGGAKLITSQIEKDVLRQTAVTAAVIPADANLAVQIVSSRPLGALAAAKAAAAAANPAVTPPAATATGSTAAEVSQTRSAQSDLAQQQPAA